MGLSLLLGHLLSIASCTAKLKLMLTVRRHNRLLLGTHELTTRDLLQ